MSAEVQTSKQTHGFQTEVSELLNLMIHSLYSKKEIFLRELISNASDAADKLRFAALSDAELYEGEGELKIHVSYDAKARTVTVKDNGIGMSREEIIDNLGTIAKSGTKQFFASLTGDEAQDAELIGQFGVGFYASFIVADEVTVRTRKAGVAPDEGVEWCSQGAGEFTVETVSCPNRGTEVVLHLREGEDDFLNGYRLRSIIRSYSDHISVPIIMPVEAVPGADLDDTSEDKNKEKADAQKEPEEETVNKATALWTRGKSDITAEEYNEFYKYISHDFEDPLEVIHNRVEGNTEYTALLYLPGRAPFDMWDRQARRGVKLYVRRVFIMDDAEQLLPTYLRFVRGVIDCSDLPLNVSREILQNDRKIESIRSGCVRRVLGQLERMVSSDEEKYAKFWGEFGRVLKEGVVEDSTNRDAIAKLLRFCSTQSEGDEPTVSLEAYVGRMSEQQEAIYYITASTLATARNSPHLEIFLKKGIEVLFLVDEIDEWVTGYLTEFDGKPLKSIAKGELDIEKLGGTTETADRKKADEEYKKLLEKIEKALGNRIKEARVTDRLTASPACLVADEHAMSGHLERMLSAAGQKINHTQPILEINPEHPIVQKMHDEKAEEKFDDWAYILHDQALLSEGGKLEDPAGFVRRLNEMFQALSAPTSSDTSSTSK